ncbi:hypothetical protein OROHE_018020 [Orobanche hederae]
MMPLWTLSSNGDFSFKTAWDMVRKKRPPNKILSLCWNPFITPTISLFMVRLFFKWIPTPDGLLRRGIIANNMCYCCNGDENMPHLFIHGPVAKEVWTYFHNLAGIKILERNDKRVDKVPFTSKRVCDRIGSFIHSIKGNLKRIRQFWKGADTIVGMVGIQPGPKPIYKILPVRWLKPVEGWWKLNSDGAAKGNPGISAAGGVIRDHLGTPCLMFSEFLGKRSNNYAELYAIWRGLEFYLNHDFVKMWVESDSTLALHMINNKGTSNWHLHGLLIKIWTLIDKMEVRFPHIFREGNVVADWLANEGCNRRDFFLLDISNIFKKNAWLY